MNFSASTFAETGRLSQPSGSDAGAGQASTRSLLVFHLGDRVYGLAIEHVAQIIAMLKLTPVPQAEQVIEGVANIRGKIVPVLSARRHLGLPLVEPQLYTPIILLNTDGRTFGLIVDEVADVVRLPATQMVGPEMILPQELENTGILEGVVYHGDVVIMVINPRCLLSPTTMRALKREPVPQPPPTFTNPFASAALSDFVPPAAGNGSRKEQTPAEPKKRAAGNGNGSGSGKSRKGRRNLHATLADELAGLAADLPPSDGHDPASPDVPSANGPSPDGLSPDGPSPDQDQKA